MNKEWKSRREFDEKREKKMRKIEKRRQKEREIGTDRGS